MSRSAHAKLSPDDAWTSLYAAITPIAVSERRSKAALPIALPSRFRLLSRVFFQELLVDSSGLSITLPHQIGDLVVLLAEIL